MTTGDIFILGLVSAVLVATAVIGLIVIVINLDTDKSTMDKWGLAAAWIAPIPTAVAVWAGMRSSRKEREALQQQHTDQLRHEAWSADLALIGGPIHEALRSLVQAMRAADKHADKYREGVTWSESGDNEAIDEDHMFWTASWTDLARAQLAVKEGLRAIRTAAISIRTPDLRTALDQVEAVLELVSTQIRDWSTDVLEQRQLGDVSDDMKALNLDTSYGIGMLSAGARHAEDTVLKAAAASQALDLWSDSDRHDATVAS